MTEATTLPTRTAAFEKRLRKRYAAERRFKALGLGAILFSVAMLALFVLLGGIAGAFTGFGLQAWISAIDYPLNIGGRPYISWPMFIPVTFELTILFASITALLTWIGLNGLPLPYHPTFNVPSFARASQDRFFLAIEANDPKFDRTRTFDFLKSVGAKEINEIQP